MSSGEWEDERHAALIRLLLNALPASNDMGQPAELAEAAGEIVAAFASFRAPTVDGSESPPTLDFLRVGRPGSGGGYSFKPGNVRLNLGNLMETLASGTLTIAGVVAVPWAWPLAALVVWRDLDRRATVPLSEHEAALLWTMWLRADDDRTMPDSDLLGSCNEEIAKHGGQPLNQGDVDIALQKLERIRCIERFKQDPSRWWLREWISINYTDE